MPHRAVVGHSVRRGWGVREMLDPHTGKTVQVQLGSAHRLKIIFNTNFRTSLAFGRWQRIERVREAMPWLRYVAVRDGRTRPEHLAWDGVVLPADDPWWDSHFPPNGWNCRCTVQQLSDEGLKRYGYTPSNGAPPEQLRTWKNRRTGVSYRVPRGIDPGFQYNVGKLRGYAKVFQAAGLSLPEELGLDAVRQIAAIRQLRSRSHDFEDLAPPVPGLPAADRRLVLDMLRRRHDLLERKVPDIYLALEPSVADATLRHEMGGFFEDALSVARNALERGVNLHGMSDAELVRLHLYTLRKGVPDQWTYEKLNEKLRSSDPATRARVNVSRVVLNNALAKLPDHQGTVYRGLSFPHEQAREDFLAKHKVGDVVQYSAFTSADVIQPYPGQAKIIIQSRRGKRITDYSGDPTDDEVLFRTDSRFRVLDLEPPEGDRPLTVQLEEE